MFIKFVWLLLSQCAWLLSISWWKPRTKSETGVRCSVNSDTAPLLKKAIRNTRLQIAYDKAYRSGPFRWSGV